MLKSTQVPMDRMTLSLIVFACQGVEPSQTYVFISQVGWDITHIVSGKIKPPWVCVVVG